MTDRYIDLCMLAINLDFVTMLRVLHVCALLVTGDVLVTVQGMSVRHNSIQLDPMSTEHHL